MTTHDFQFYPTPPTLAARAWAKFKDRNFIRILEPSAGDGALANQCPGRRDRYAQRVDIDVCEIDVTKHPLLRELGLNVVGLDFLQFGAGTIYSHIVMNPPFSDGAKHVLKAWELIWDGEIVAIINADTIRNPYSMERQQLVKLIGQHGNAELIEGAFQPCRRRQ